MLPAVIKNKLEASSLYLRIRYSKPVLQFWLLLRPDVAAALSRQKAFYHALLRPLKPTLVFDIGANEGFITQMFADLGCRVIAVEPAARNAAILSARFGRWDNIVIVPSAVSDKKGHAKFYSDVANDYALGTLNEKQTVQETDRFRTDAVVVATTTLDDLIEAYGFPQFIKIDVEGWEEFVLKGLYHRIPLIAFEAMLPLFIGATFRCIEMLTQINPNATFNIAVDYKMLYDSFSNAQTVTNKLKHFPSQTVEIFCRLC